MRPIGGDLASACRAVLLTADPAEKCKAARAVARDWRQGRIAFAFGAARPDRPGQPDEPPLLPPTQMPRRGKGGSDQSRIAMIHALAHIEYVAIDLAFDMVGRFGAQMPRAFADDFLAVGADEAMHFALLDRRLRSLGSRYGAMPAHGGLWEAATATMHDLDARLAVVPMVLEARGLDVTPMTIARFAAAGDARTVTILERILRDEEKHVLAGTRWFESRCQGLRLNPESHWRTLVSTHFRGALKPPFNDSARRRAGLTREYYAAIA